MALNVDTRQCASGSRAANDPYAAGMILMMLGLRRVDPQAPEEAAFRWAVLIGLYGPGGVPSGWDPTDLIGVDTNVGTESTAGWIRRLHDVWTRERRYERGGKTTPVRRRRQRRDDTCALCDAGERHEH
jgi:hypothetical protein